MRFPDNIIYQWTYRCLNVLTDDRPSAAGHQTERADRHDGNLLREIFLVNRLLKLFEIKLKFSSYVVVKFLSHSDRCLYARL